MKFEEFIKRIGNAPAKIEAKVDEKCEASIYLEGRGLELLSLSMQIAEDVLEKTHTDVENYCVMLKEEISGKNDDSKADEESREESKSITKEQFKEAWKKVMDNLLNDKDLDATKVLLFSMVSTKCANDMCEILFGEGLKDE